MVFNPTIPSFSGNGVAIWESTTKTNKPYLKVKVLGGSVINCFKVELKNKA